MADTGARLTPIGKMLSTLLVAGLLTLGVYVFMQWQSKPTPVQSSRLPNTNESATRGGARTPPTKAGLAELNLIEAATEVPKLAAPGVYTPKDNTVEIELSEYAGYAGLIAANGGLDASESSYFYTKHGFKVKIKLSEEESWSALNSGMMAASATTTDVLAIYGKQFQVLVPAQIGFSRGADGIVVRSDIRRVNSLKGKVLVASQFTEAEFFLRFLALEAGIGVSAMNDLSAPPDPDRINLVFAEEGPQAGELFLEDIKSGGNRLSGFVAWEPTVSEVAEASNGKANVLVTNKNLLVVADVLIVNKGFADQNPTMVAGLVDGLLAGNRMVRDDPGAHLSTIAGAFGWEQRKASAELAKVHLSNLPENIAFFSGAIDTAGSFGGIFQSAVYAYGKELIRDPAPHERFLELKHLHALKEAGAYAEQKPLILPIKSASGSSVEVDPLLTKEIRFLFKPNDSVLDQSSAENMSNLEAIRNLLQISPGSTVLLRGHVDDARVPEFRKAGGEQYVRKMAMEAVELSKRRAQEIRRLLIEIHRIDAARIETIGRGWDEPAGKDSDKNRRVEVQWFTLE